MLLRWLTPGFDSCLTGAPKIAILLRDPTRRAWSSYFQGTDVIPLPRTAEGFHRYVRVEMAIVNQCGTTAIPVAVPLETHEVAFRKCCVRAAASAGMPNAASFPGCNCRKVGTVSQRQCSAYGDKRAATVRMGLYARE